MPHPFAESAWPPSTEQLNARCPEGKTALHWAVEMASVGSVRLLVAAGVDASVEDGKGRTVGAILDAVEQSGVIARLKNALVLKDAGGDDGAAGAAGAAAGAT